MAVASELCNIIGINCVYHDIKNSSNIYGEVVNVKLRKVDLSIAVLSNCLFSDRLNIA